ncbi:MAG: Tol-Pal system protein TolB [Rhodospirillaceae bacterium]|nr:Tol-Pal system protein TolB [Rhodospirillaceae bacterium]MCA8930953.1 Tol-Pal system protein TolB [Rhodospirillaceae bacterium]
MAGGLGAAALAMAPAGLSRRAHAQLQIDISQGTFEPLPIAIPPFAGGDSRGPEIAQIITANLERSGLFRAVNPNAFIQDPESLAAAPRFADWRVIDADAVVAGSVAAQADGRLRAEFRLWDTVAETQLAGLAYFTAPDNFRRVAHIISDAIFTAVTGEPGYFDSRIVYISESGPATERVKRLAIMDQDGANHRHLTDGSNLVLTPRFSPSTQEITYLDYNGTQPRVFLYNIDTGRREVLGNFPGMTFSPRFSPDGNRVVMSLSQGGGTDLFVMDLRTRTSRRLTSSAGIDTSPCYNEDGTRIVFESDRGGSQQLYVMGADGGGVDRISYGDGRYAEPVWSPRGDLIAFTRVGGGNWGIGVMRPDGTGERMLQEGYQLEGPTWAPNGRYLMYFASGGGGARLRGVDVSGRTTWDVPTPQDGSDPAWSPLNP